MICTPNACTGARIKEMIFTPSQINEDTANRRPIMLTRLSPAELKLSNEKKEENTPESQSSESKMDTDTEVASTSQDKQDLTVVSGLSSPQISSVIRLAAFNIVSCYWCICASRRHSTTSFI